LQHLGATRSSLKPDHLLQTPDTFVRIPLAQSPGVEFIVHAGPQLGARFSQMTAEFAPQSALGPSPVQRFIYVLEGNLDLAVNGGHHALGPGGFAYIPQGTPHSVIASIKSRAAVIEKAPEPVAGTPAPTVVVGSESAVSTVALMGDESLRVCSRIPDNDSYDFAVNTMTYDPGAALSMVEIHVMEHGLLMLEGGGIYRLGDSWYPVQAGDFIWMAPYCPQWFGALGKTPAKYLIYKDWRRHPLGTRR
jgi:(S)-ureidoglycine aminohydrolase